MCLEAPRKPTGVRVLRANASRPCPLSRRGSARIMPIRGCHGPPKKRSASAAASARLRCRPTPLEWSRRPAWSRRTQTYHGVRWTRRTSYHASFSRRQKIRSRISRTVHRAVPTSSDGLATGGAGFRGPIVVTRDSRSPQPNTIARRPRTSARARKAGSTIRTTLDQSTSGHSFRRQRLTDPGGCGTTSLPSTSTARWRPTPTEPFDCLSFLATAREPGERRARETARDPGAAGASAVPKTRQVARPWGGRPVSQARGCQARVPSSRTNSALYQDGRSRPRRPRRLWLPRMFRDTSFDSRRSESRSVPVSGSRHP